LPNQKLLPWRGSSHVQKHVEKHDSEENELQICEDQDAPELFNATIGFLANDEVPETLTPVLKILENNFVPETITALAKPHRFYLLQPVRKPLLYRQVRSRQKSEHCWRHVAWIGF